MQQKVLLKFYFSLLMGMVSFVPGTSGQRHVVENVSFRAVDKNVVVINYDLMGSGSNKLYRVDLFVHQTRSPNQKFKPGAIIGDVGKGRFEGRDNKIIWSMDHETDTQFIPSPFIDDYYFSIEARRKSNAGWVIIPALLGGAAYFFYSNML